MLTTELLLAKAQVATPNCYCLVITPVSCKRFHNVEHPIHTAVEMWKQYLTVHQSDEFELFPVSMIVHNLNHLH